NYHALHPVSLVWLRAKTEVESRLGQSRSQRAAEHRLESPSYDVRCDTHDDLGTPHHRAVINHEEFAREWPAHVSGPLSLHRRGLFAFQAAVANSQRPSTRRQCQRYLKVSTDAFAPLGAPGPGVKV